MRIFKIFFMALVALVVASFFLGLLSREFLLAYSSTLLANDIKKLKAQNYQGMCESQFATQAGYYTQLRFTSVQEYNLEVVCKDFAEQPLILASRHLPLLVKKTSATAGLVVENDALPTYIELSILGRTATAYVEGLNYHFSYWKKPNLDFSQGPLTTCQALNATCCRLEIESGLGEARAGVSDCPKSCYAQCATRPQLLSFNSRPAAENRAVALRSGDAITFAYVVTNTIQSAFAGEISADTASASPLLTLESLFETSPTRSQSALLPITVTVIFGDGDSHVSQNLQESFDHVYTCKTRLCYYQVILQATDALGIPSLDNELAHLTIKVTN